MASKSMAKSLPTSRSSSDRAEPSWCRRASAGSRASRSPRKRDLRDPGISLDADHFRQVELARRHGFLGTQIARHDIPDRLASVSRFLSDRRPSCNLVLAPGIDWFLIEAHRGNALPHLRRGIADVAQTSDADHIAALLIIGVRVEQIVGDVLEHGFDRLPG